MTEEATLHALRQVREQAEENLAENVLPFWANHAWDEEAGGFLTRLDRQGRRPEAEEKVLMMQVRMIAALSWAHQFGLRDAGYLDMARGGYDFLAQHFWDKAEGGFIFSTDRAGQPRCLRKNTDFHGYAITGLIAYYEATQDPEALEWAGRVLEVLQARAADGMGYVEDFDGHPWPVLNSEQMGLGDRQGIKTIDMHTNMLEALTYLSRASGKSEHRALLRDLFDRILRHGLDQHGGTVTAFDTHWKPLPDAQGQFTTSYGLNVELAWLLLEAVDVLNLDRESYRGPILGLIDHALEYGFDWERGGLAAYGPMSGNVLEAHGLPPTRLVKPWWGQAELMNALVDAHSWTGEGRYGEALVKLWDWIWTHQIDHEYGDWYAEVDWTTGAPQSTDKGGEFKTAFHVSRALIRTVQGLQRGDMPP